MRIVIWWEITLGLLVGLVLGVMAGLNVINANEYLIQGLPRAALYSFQYALNHHLLTILGYTAVVCLITLICRLLPNTPRVAALFASMGLAIYVAFKIGYKINRYDFKFYWLDSKRFLGLPLREGFLEPKVLLFNIGVLAVTLFTGWICYKTVLFAVRMVGSRKIAFSMPIKPYWVALGMVLLLIGFNLYCNIHRSRNQFGGPNVILISLDTLRADHLRCYGYDRNTSPNIDRLTTSSVLFENAITQSGWTLPSHKSVLTSLDPLSCQTGANPKLDPRQITLPEILLNAGFATAAYANGLGWVTPTFGFEQGFGTYVVPSQKIIPRFPTAELITKLALSWLKKHKKNNFFLFLHYGDIHSDFGDFPYEAPEPFGSMFVPADAEGYPKEDWQIGGSLYLYGINTGRFKPSAEEIDYIEALYDGGIRYTDEHIGKLVDGLEEMGILDETILIIFSDHGEEFMEHGKMLHGHVYCENAHVPLILRFPEAAWAGERVSLQVQLMDIMPTVLEYLQITTDKKMRGRSLLNIIREGDTPQPAVTEGGTAFAIRADGWMFMHDKEGERKELYNLQVDPLERNNVISLYPQQEGKLVGLLGDLIELAHANKLLGKDEEVFKLDPKTEALLKSLGYITGGE